MYNEYTLDFQSWTTSAVSRTKDNRGDSVARGILDISCCETAAWVRMEEAGNLSTN